MDIGYGLVTSFRKFFVVVLIVKNWIAYKDFVINVYTTFSAET